MAVFRGRVPPSFRDSSPDFVGAGHWYYPYSKAPPSIDPSELCCGFLSDAITHRNSQ